jgi:hypothetical protein
MTPPSNLFKSTLPFGIRSMEVDMSPAAIESRLRMLGHLHKAWQSLRHFKKVEHKVITKLDTQSTLSQDALIDKS